MTEIPENVLWALVQAAADALGWAPPAGCTPGAYAEWVRRVDPSHLSEQLLEALDAPRVPSMDMAQRLVELEGRVVMLEAQLRTPPPTYPASPPVWSGADIQPVLAQELQDRWAYPADQAARLAAEVTRRLQVRGIWQ